MIDRLAPAVERLRQAALVEQWSKGTEAFVRGANVLTIDEHDANSRKPFPEREDATIFWQALDAGENSWVIKSRQNLVSWDCRVSDLQLALFRPNVKIALVFDDKDDAIEQIENRIKPMFESLPEWFQQRYVIRDYVGSFIVESCGGVPWRSYITPIARGKNQLRSRVYTRINWEEAATQDWMRTAYMGAKPTVQGRRDKDGTIKRGQIVVVSTPQPNTFYLELGGSEVDRGVAIARGDQAPDVGEGVDKIHRPTRGLATWKNTLGYTCFAWHWSADPGKDAALMEAEAATTPGGKASDLWRQEQEMDTNVLGGRSTYWAFRPQRNVVKEWPAPIPEMRTWKIFLSADFGATDPTCFLFWAENPATRQLLIWDSIYVVPKPDRDGDVLTEVKHEIYQKLKRFHGYPAEAQVDIRTMIAYAVGDPQGKIWLQGYNAKPLPIPISGNPPNAKVKLNDRFAGETRLNSFFSAQYICCPTEKNPTGVYYAERGACPICQKPVRGEPRLLILEGACPELVDQLPTIRKKTHADPELEQSQRDVKVADHAVDAAKYGAMSTNPEPILRRFEPAAAATGVDQRFARHCRKIGELAEESWHMGEDATEELDNLLSPFGRLDSDEEDALV